MQLCSQMMNTPEPPAVFPVRFPVFPKYFPFLEIH